MVLMPLLAAGLLASRRAARPVVAVSGRADDVFDDLAPLFQLPVVRRYDLSCHPWRFAVLVGLVVAAAVGPFAGPAGAVGEFAVLLVCFRVLGRPGNGLGRGTALPSAQTWRRNAPAVRLNHAAALAVTVLSFIRLGDAVREALDPTARKR